MAEQSVSNGLTITVTSGLSTELTESDGDGTESSATLRIGGEKQ